MSYENPKQPEDINVGVEHPLKDFFAMLSAVLLIVVIAVLMLSTAAQWLARYIPFSTELQVAQAIEPHLTEVSEGPIDETARQRQVYLSQLAQRLSSVMNLPEGMVVSVHYSADSTVNAFATLGGHVLMYGGLVDKLPSENALAMVLAHEIAHVKLRHPIVAMSRGLTVSIALGSVFGMTDNAAVAQLVQWLGITSSLSFSRAQELAADEEAAQAVLALYGHLEGATALFDVLATMTAREGVLQVPEFVSTHPDLTARIERLAEIAAELGVSGSLTPLPWRPLP
ncbi:MAG: M48 family metallopeptidase [Pseudomonadales bacterium]